MIRTNKDLVFAISVVLWLSSNILGYIIGGDFGTCVSNIICIGLFGTMTVVKLKHRRFGLWLDKRIEMIID